MLTDIPSATESGSQYDKHSADFLVQPFDNQVSGHFQDAHGNFAGVLKCQDQARIWKPFGKSPGCLKELRFYTSANASDVAEDVKKLKKFLPAFYGVAQTGESDAEKFFVLEDLTHDLQLPCCADIKIGKKTYEPSATQNKIDFENSRYVGTKLVAGFCLPGAKFYSLKENTWINWDKRFGYALLAKDAGNAIFTFLNRSRCLTKEVLKQLKQLLDWFEHVNSSFAFYASSVLVTYDAAKLKESEEFASNLGPVRVRMIDFAHTLPILEAYPEAQKTGNNISETGNIRDENYIHGLKNLIKCLEEASAECDDPAVVT